MLIDTSYFLVTKEHIMSLSDEITYLNFLEWNAKNGNFQTLPWGDTISVIEGFVIEDEDFELQEDVFTNCTLEIENLIYKLKKIQLKEHPNSKASLAFLPRSI